MILTALSMDTLDAYSREQRSALMPLFTLNPLGADKSTIKRHLSE